MGPQTISNAAPPPEVDVVVIGGGAAGAVVAGRLAKADPTLQIAVLEHGQNNKDMPTVSVPFSAHEAWSQRVRACTRRGML